MRFSTSATGAPHYHGSCPSIQPYQCYCVQKWCGTYHLSSIPVFNNSPWTIHGVFGKLTFIFLAQRQIYNDVNISERLVNSRDSFTFRTNIEGLLSLTVLIPTFAIHRSASLKPFVPHRHLCLDCVPTCICNELASSHNLHLLSQSSIPSMFHSFPENKRI